MPLDEPSPEPFYVVRVAPPLGLLCAVGLAVAFAIWHSEAVGFLTRAFWGAPVWVVWLLVLAVLAGMLIASTERTLFVVKPATRTATFRRYLLWLIPVSERTIRFEDIRHIDLHHTGEHSVSGMPRLTEWLSPEYLHWGQRLFFNGLSVRSWIADWMLCAVPYSGVAEIRVFLNDRTEWTIMRAGSEEHVAAIGSELKRLTGARLT